LILILLVFSAFSGSKRGVFNLGYEKETQSPLVSIYIASFRLFTVILVSFLAIKSFPGLNNLFAIFTISVITAGALLSLFGHIVPVKLLTRFTFLSAFALKVTKLLVLPLEKPFNVLVKRYSKELEESENETEKQVIQEISEPEKRKIIKGIVNFSEKEVSQIMTRKDEVYAIDITLDKGQVIRRASESGFSRLPVYEGNIDKISGFVYIKDLLELMKEESGEEWKSLIRGAHYTQCTKHINELLDEMRENKIHMSVVVYANGKTAGIVTLEDILEEVLGEISDETDNN
jgi:CBS domain containing-hemolysin-like protein